MNAIRLSTDEALQMLADAFAEPVPLAPDMPRDDVGGWDSMGSLMLMAELDERFGLQLTANESRSMRHVRDVLDYLRANGVLDG
ncbi:acyl carrier protein [Marilutibacter alkalisoli]|uniref:Acyl carrier protein n=1 Tax=Marilutibacter alkalisoli TaxID=2591633 RepID=A0A514BRH8_9GAMM|nr:acyl carrier protein [Lysobacter alkalisoli]QDH70012.1 acyl carrier protein [Lysobacter alkalisoli]